MNVVNAPALLNHLLITPQSYPVFYKMQHAVDKINNKYMNEPITNIDDITLNPDCKWAKDAKFVMNAIIDKTPLSTIVFVDLATHTEFISRLKRASLSLLGKSLRVKIIGNNELIRHKTWMIKTHDIIFIKNGISGTADPKIQYKFINQAISISEKIKAINQKAARTGNYVTKILVILNLLPSYNSTTVYQGFGDMLYQSALRTYKTLVNAPADEITALAEMQHRLLLSEHNSAIPENGNVLNLPHNLQGMVIPAPAAHPAPEEPAEPQ